MTNIQKGDICKVVSCKATKGKYGLNGHMEQMVGRSYAVDNYEKSPNGGFVVKMQGFAWDSADLEVVDHADENLIIPVGSNHSSCTDNGEYGEITKKINFVSDYLQGLHNTDVFKKGQYKTMKYDGSGKLALEAMPNYIMTKLKFDLLQRKKVGFLRDRPDVIIMMDNSGSVAGAGMCNHMRVLGGAISDVFFAELNKIILITFGHKGCYYEFEEKEQMVDHLLDHTFFDEGCTRYDLAFIEAMKNGVLQQNLTRPRLIILITDGVPTDLSRDVEKELDKLREKGEFKKEGYKEKYKELLRTITSKSTLIKTVDMIASLSALSNTVFRIYVLSENSRKDVTFERIAQEVTGRLKQSKQWDDTSKILMRRFLNEIMKNSVVHSFGDFLSGAAYSAIVEDIKSEFYKLNAER